jgi:CelD/BcsL family acetyltransferase involved in cellulose biosynthesis
MAVEERKGCGIAEPEITLAAFPDFGKLAEEWRALEERARAFSFFQSWTWLGCLAAERFAEPVLVRATRQGKTVGLALFNRRGNTLYLAESGDRDRDSIYIEHNAPLVEQGAPPELQQRILAAAWSVPGIRRLVLSGVPHALPAAAGGIPLRLRTQPAPFVDLEAIRGSDFLTTRSRNTRAQLRRSLRHFEALGPMSLSRPGSDAETLAWLAEMIRLHADAWQSRGKPGAFAGSFMRRFHEALAREARGRGELDLLRIDAGGQVLGFLYNFRHGGTVYAYQSGFRQFPGTPQARPGVVGHALAIEEALAAGLTRYDFLAGDARYKRSLATGETMLAWAELVRPDIVGRVHAKVHALVSGIRGRLAPSRRTGLLSSRRAASSGDRTPPRQPQERA